jgi:hypothetical protein
MSTALVEPAESEIFARVIGSEEAMPADVARAVLEWKFPKSDLKRVHVLQERNNAGTISTTEYRELERYVRVSEFVAVMQARAKLALKGRRGKA